MSRSDPIARAGPRSPTRASPLLVAIVGGSGAGKSWLAQQLQRILGQRLAETISLDEFYRDRSHLSVARRVRLNFDNPAAIDWPALEIAMDHWLAGKSAEIPCYDFSTHCRRISRRLVPAKPVLLIEGLWLLHRRSLRNKFALRIFIECSRSCRFSRRLARDRQQRGRTVQSIQEQFQTTVEPMHAKFVEPQKKWADIVLDGHMNREDVRRLMEMINRKLKGKDPVSVSLISSTQTLRSILPGRVSQHEKSRTQPKQSDGTRLRNRRGSVRQISLRQRA
jgi:uridine kinase